jgi:hypothetical protein
MKDEQTKNQLRPRKFKTRYKFGYFFLCTAIIIFLYSFFFYYMGIPIIQWNHTLLFILTLLILISIFSLLDITRILFDPEEYTPNYTKQDIVQKIRYRGVLFNNIAIILFRHYFCMFLYTY